MRGSSGHRFESQRRANNRSKEGKTKSMNTTETREAKRSLWERILALLEKDLAERRHSKIFVDLPGESGPNHKEIGALSQAEMRTLEPGLRIRVVNRLLERYLAEQGHVDLLKGRHPYSKDIRDLAPADLSALIEADRKKGEEREREEFVREVRGDLDQLPARLSGSSTGSSHSSSLAA
jgi:hypothetical protein